MNNYYVISAKEENEEVFLNVDKFTESFYYLKYQESFAINGGDEFFELDF